MPTTTRRPSKRQPAATTDRSSRVVELSERLKAFADSLDDDEQAAYAARFDYYSPRNAMLIVMQDPDATVVRAFKAWLAEGRCVRKDERSRIAILAPAGRTGGEHTDDAAKAGAQPGEVAATKVRQFFRLVPVFDISQTETPEEAAAAAVVAGPLTEAEEDALGEDL